MTTPPAPPAVGPKLDEIWSGCTRSHPHENMNTLCQRFTEYESRLAAERARADKWEAACLAQERLNIEAYIEFRKMRQRAEAAEKERDFQAANHLRAQASMLEQGKEFAAAEALATRLAHERDGFRNAWNQAQEYADKLDAAEARAAELEHDIARHVEICAEEATRAEELERALEEAREVLVRIAHHSGDPLLVTIDAALRRPDV